MTAIDRYSAHDSLEIAHDAWSLSQRIARTEFVPDTLKGKPEAVLACILAGHELGISPMQSLQEIHVIKGRPALSAKMQRAIILRAGHEIWIEESSSTRAIVRGKRRDTGREGAVTWTDDDARRALLTGKDNWKHYPAAMLIARASSQLARNLFPDVLAGFGYALEELEDGFDELGDLGPPTESVADSPTLRARAGKDHSAGPPPPDPEPEPRPEREEAPLPGETIDTTARDLDDVEPAGAGADPIGDDVEPDLDETAKARSGPQQIAIVFSRRDITDRETRLRICSTIIGHPIESGNELTTDEISLVLSYLSSAPEDEKLPGEEPEAEPDPPRPDPPRAEESSPAGREGTAESSTSEPESVSQPTGSDVGEPPARRTPSPARPDDPERWTADDWRGFLVERGVKASELLRYGAELAATESLKPPDTLDDLQHFGIAAALIGWAEDRALERGTGS